MCCGPVCVGLVQGLPAAVVASTVGIAGWVIARHQVAVAEAKLKLDLFDKRYPIFQQTWEIMSAVAKNGTREQHFSLGNPFSNFKPQAEFLFSKEVEAYLSAAIDKWVDLSTLEAEGEAAQNAARVRELKNWFHKEASTGLRKVFGPYLNFEKWK